MAQSSGNCVGLDRHVHEDDAELERSKLGRLAAAASSKREAGANRSRVQCRERRAGLSVNRCYPIKAHAPVCRVRNSDFINQMDTPVTARNGVRRRQDVGDERCELWAAWLGRASRHQTNKRKDDGDYPGKSFGSVHRQYLLNLSETVTGLRAGDGQPGSFRRDVSISASPNEERGKKISCFSRFIR